MIKNQTEYDEIFGTGKPYGNSQKENQKNAEGIGQIEKADKRL